jgi:predicted DNA-binding transcriptional regulator AlpA
MAGLVDPNDLVGVHEGCEVVGLSDARLGQLLRDDPAFPQPVREVRATKLWLRQDLEAWRDTRVKKAPGRPTRAAKAAERAALDKLNG